MDNQNNPNSHNNPTPAEPTPPLPPPGTTMPDWLTPTQPTQPQSGPTSAPVDPTPFTSTTTPTWPSDTTKPEENPLSLDPGAASTSSSDTGSMPSLSSAWTPPTQSEPDQHIPSNTWPQAPSGVEPAAPQSSPDIPPPEDQTSTWTPPIQTPPQSEPTPPSPQAIQSEPTPTFTPPTTFPSSTEPISSTVTTVGSEPSLSPIDNPWKTPVQSAPVDQPPAATQPSWTNIPGNQPEIQTESTPTDLSHLIGNNNSQQEPSTQPASETLVVPPTPTPDVPTLPTGNHNGMPKWLIGLGAGLLILVVGASAYFILGIGQPSKTTTSLPATVAPKTAEVKPPIPTATPVPQPTVQPASGSANFGELGGNSSEGTQATSAAELLRQRQLGR